MTKSLFNISQEFLEIQEQLLDSGGEATPELEQQLQITEHELQHKVGGYRSVIQGLGAEADIIDAEVKRLQVLKKIRTNAIDRMKTSIKDAMVLFGVKKIESPLGNVTLVHKDSVNINDETLIPKHLTKTVTQVSVDKTAVKAALENGEDVPGAELVDSPYLRLT